MQELNRQMMALPELRELEEIIRFGTGPAAVSGVSGVHRAMLGAALRQETKRPLAVLCADEQEARRMAADLAALTGEECVTLFAREWQLRDRVSASHSFEQERLDALCRMAFGRMGIVVATVDGMMQRTLPPTALRDAVLTLRLGEEHDLRALAERLTAAGYVRCEQVEGAGQFARRGGIIDFFSPAYPEPVRIEFWGDDIDSMGFFDIKTQRRTESVEICRILPAAESLMTLASGGTESLTDALRAAADKCARHKSSQQLRQLEQNLRADIERLEQNVKIEYYARINHDTPKGLVISREGEELTDSAEILKKIRSQQAALAPLGGFGETTGGYKGYGYSTVVEILSAALQSGLFLKALDGKDEEGKIRPYHLGHFFIAIDTEAFMGAEAFKKTCGDILRDLRGSEKAPGQERIYTAGEKEYDVWMYRKDKGVPVTEAVQKEFIGLRDEFGLTQFKFPFEK